MNDNESDKESDKESDNSDDNRQNRTPTRKTPPCLGARAMIFSARSLLEGTERSSPFFVPAVFREPATAYIRSIS
jgi:hypothetical protein